MSVPNSCIAHDFLDGYDPEFSGILGKVRHVHALLESMLVIGLPLIKTLIRITVSSPANGTHLLMIG